MPVIFLRLLFGAMLCLASIPFQASARDWTGNGALILGGGGVFSGNLVVTNTISGAQKFYRLVNP